MLSYRARVIRKRNSHSLQVCMGKRLVGRKSAQKVTVILIIVADVLVFTSTLIMRDIGGIALSLALTIFCLGSYFYVSKRKKKIRYPLVPPEGRGDIYSPRTDIPRPIIEDFRKIEEKKRKFARINKMIRKERVRKKK